MFRAYVCDTHNYYVLQYLPFRKTKNKESKITWIWKRSLILTTHVMCLAQPFGVIKSNAIIKTFRNIGLDQSWRYRFPLMTLKIPFYVTLFHPSPFQKKNFKTMRSQKWQNVGKRYDFTTPLKISDGSCSMFEVGKHEILDLAKGIKPQKIDVMKLPVRRTALIQNPSNFLNDAYAD